MKETRNPAAILLILKLIGTSSVMFLLILLRFLTKHLEYMAAQVFCHSSLKDHSN